MTRKVISLQTVVLNTNDSDAPGGSYWELRYVALCDDGSMWFGSGNYREGHDWTRMTDIPQS